MAEAESKESLYRQLGQTNRLIAQVMDTVTRERLQAHLLEIQDKLDAMEARDTDAPPE